LYAANALWIVRKTITPIAVATIAERRMGLAAGVSSSRTAEAGDPPGRGRGTAALERDFMMVFSADAERACNQALAVT
jgi:hypothetical protein